MTSQPVIDQLAEHTVGDIGLRLIGGRLLAAGDRPIAQLIYEDSTGHRLTLCLSSAPLEAGDEIELVDVGELNAGYWHEGDLRRPTRAWSRSHRSSAPRSPTTCRAAPASAPGARAARVGCPDAALWCAIPLEGLARRPPIR